MEDFLEKLSGSEKIEGKQEPTKPVKEESEEGQLAVDVFQTDNEIVVQSTIAGVKASDLDITIQNDMVSIKGERKKLMELPKENYFYQECYWGPFSRSIILPEEINANEARAELKDGVLILHLPKSEKIKTTKISVKEIE
ncbi:MAG: heat-shock protein Hsp20 [Parcubacteria group bacterium CG_4_9_14_0_2_um_filter_35_11]|nr:MAG: heat-shock protein Hsp20 [Parcubacteria group bacterium CG_4_9_14_0_2_um_filter_35_11]